MLVRAMFTVVALACIASTAAAQNKTVTNSDLEQYRQQRERAESELRLHYERIGLTLDDVKRREEESHKEMLELSAMLRAERAERERIQAERERAEALTIGYLRSRADIYWQAPNYWNGGWFGGRPIRGHGAKQYQQPGYFAGGQFWPTGAATPRRPVFRPGRHH